MRLGLCRDAVTGVRKVDKRLRLRFYQTLSGQAQARQRPRLGKPAEPCSPVHGATSKGLAGSAGGHPREAGETAQGGLVPCVLGFADRMQMDSRDGVPHGGAITHERLARRLIAAW